MYKASYRDIKELIGSTNWEDGAFNKDDQVSGYQIAYFTPAGANWAYKVDIVKHNNLYYEVVTVFGGIRGYRYINL